MSESDKEAEGGEAERRQERQLLEWLDAMSTLARRMIRQRNTLEARIAILHSLVEEVMRRVEALERAQGPKR